jgi:hypothetical protein
MMNELRSTAAMIEPDRSFTQVDRLLWRNLSGDSPALGSIVLFHAARR